MFACNCTLREMTIKVHRKYRQLVSLQQKRWDCSHHQLVMGKQRKLIAKMMGDACKMSFILRVFLTVYRSVSQENAF